MPPALRIRRYRSGDGARVRELHEDAMRDVGAFVEGVPETDLQDVRGAYLDAGGEFLVGELPDRVVAMGAFRPATGYVTEFLDDLTESAAELRRMRVDPAHQREGYGQRLYDELERRARDSGFSELVLDTSPGQDAARGLYEANGFEPAGRETIRAFEEDFELQFYRKEL